MTNLIDKSTVFTHTESVNKPSSRISQAWKVAPNVFSSFRFAWAGVIYTFKTQRNFRIHTAIALLALSSGLIVHVTMVKMAILALTCALVMILELLNTAIEAVVDLTVGTQYHQGAKIAKDCAAGAVLVSAIASVFQGKRILKIYEKVVW
ncbi:diacylglycerol kinase family protein [Cyanobacterium stanieri LEGE 03274]|uniref:Diacylglycerol kinase family protein n=1 Tax=Cyanobacterium stanieri LEGE 03274 TaxID=1828756 RepID=A0ABR9V2S5_9CHRO|nr:diacylglycerol kinase family protein [Cyanobacterium stanieri]MBE9221851.1 diacylglycerol kinase family protein [Cyanobacterium stanieri LEGE 03274]